MRKDLVNKVQDQSQEEKRRLMKREDILEFGIKKKRKIIIEFKGKRSLLKKMMVVISSGNSFRSLLRYTLNINLKRRGRRGWKSCRSVIFEARRLVVFV